MFDPSGTGKVSVAHVGSILRAMNLNPTLKDVETFTAEVKILQFFMHTDLLCKRAINFSGKK